MKKIATRKVSPTSKTRWDDNHINMLNTVIALIFNATYIATTQSIAALNNFILTIQTNLATISTLKSITTSPITGYAAQKKTVRNALEAISVSIMNSVYAYAVASNNTVLANEVKNAASRLGRAGYREFLDSVSAAITSVTPFVTDGSLTSYNITPATMTVWNNLTNQLNDLITTPQTAIATRTATNDNIQIILLECMVILTNNCDALVTQFKTTNETYYAAYWSSRRLHEHHQPTQLRIYATDQTGAPVPDGEVFIVGTDRNAQLDENGYARVNHIPFGKHNITLTTPFGSYNYGPYNFKMGKVRTLHVKVTINIQARTTSSIVTKQEETTVTIEK